MVVGPIHIYCNHWSYIIPMKRGPKPKDHALYINGELICVGTMQEIAISRGVQYKTVRRWKTPTCKNRKYGTIELIELEDDDE